MDEILVSTLFLTWVRSEETAKITLASRVSELSEAAKLKLPAVVSEVPQEAFMRFSLKGAGLGIDVAVEIPIGESGGQSPKEKDGNLFYCKSWSRIICKKSADPAHTWLT